MLSPLTHDDPALLGGYRLVARLGSGGMGTVYLARSGGGRTVALKTMHASIAADPVARTRFRLETDAARIIGDRHGAAVFDADPLADTPWLATEYVLGPPLDEAVHLCGPLPEPSVRALGAALAGALAQLHSSDVVHRDLKPSNVMVTAYGPKVIDFGIAHAAGDDRLTRTGAAAGTPAFMSPEQATGQEHTPAGDVFALAGVLTFAATGRGPFGTGGPADLLYRVRYAEPDLTALPPSLAPLISRCLSKDPAQRPTTTGLAAALHDGHGDFADHLPPLLLADIARRATEVWLPAPYRLPAPPGESTGPAPRGASVSRRRLLTAGGGSVLGVTAAGAGAWAWLGRGGGPDDGRGGTSAKTPAPTGKPVAEHDWVWQKQIGGETEEDIFYPSLPHVIGDHVGLVSGTSVTYLDARDGTEGKGFDQGGATHQVVSDGSRLYALENTTGKGQPLVISDVDPVKGTSTTRATFPEYQGSHYENQLLCVAGGVAYVAAGTGRVGWTGFSRRNPWYLVAVDLDSGGKRWTQPLPLRPKDSERMYALAAGVTGGLLVLLMEDGDGKVSVVARDTRTGARRWEQPVAVGKPDALRTLLAADGEHVYLHGPDELIARRLKDGTAAWRFGPGRGATGGYGPAVVKDGSVYAAEGAALVALDAATGKLIWQERPVAGARPSMTVAPVVGTKHLYAPGASGLRVVGLADGTTVRTLKTVGARFAVHRKAGKVLALGGHFLSAFPLQ
ncbi:protein kinase domain-containing protein [Streptomyces sp. SP18CS02]|uniref:protein kinase domain-containing protein n=1 Tax=Streptomyces sp. SP18CS02 TaxID=3002531 RepID=UPI002E765056|nr:protein kinase [Streptomyces sp. SP18CS02]MEE1752267.1 protein kinase [Streptomyces sp. SP18CS02]